MTRGALASLKKCVGGKATNTRVRGTVRFMSSNLTPVAFACRIHEKADVTTWLIEPESKQYVRCLYSVIIELL